MVVAVIVTPVALSAPTTGPSHVKVELVQFQFITPVAEVHVYVPLAVCVPVPVATAGVADAWADSTLSPEAFTAVTTK